MSARVPPSLRASADKCRPASAPPGFHLIFLPKLRHEQHEQSEKFEAAEDHDPAEEDFGGFTELREVHGRADGVESGADVQGGCENGADTAFEADSGSGFKKADDCGGGDADHQIEGDEKQRQFYVCCKRIFYAVYLHVISLSYLLTLQA